MTVKDRIIQCVLENPTASNAEIANQIDAGEATLHRMKVRGQVAVEYKETGRYITVESIPVGLSETNWKRGYYETLLSHLDSILNSDASTKDKLEAIRLYERYLNKM